ncbi:MULTISPECIES: NAD-dependent epimerase/dehydratase family protein [Pseudanabaena]|uniref:UDP-glucuronate decarboxylase n=2 Tax=Pseudanabaena TaxID=1152 RepID=L8N3C4_9CYAN|nr:MULTISPECIES: NAD-dependent epimerase/dehydratase family protein [Pseudanabaena]ELS33599.1 UDP-glucuronate decarboxylase [Pseudanabaena biceps PCC 7429]MDG3494201.1 NAD-dependent epimerase/dehydratase family protein [Pseudanabaena catenata USMAC16]
MSKKIIEEDLKNIISTDLPWEEFKDSTVLISGASGFLPAYMVDTLMYLNKIRGLNIEVIGLVRNKEKALSRFANYQNRKDFRLLVQDVCSPIDCTDNIDYIIHAASQASPKYYGSDPVGTLSANILGTHNLLTLACKNSLKSFLFFSSCEVYGQVVYSQIPTKEDRYGYLDPLHLRSCYAESKRMGETMCLSWFSQYGLPTKIVRPFHTYGFGMSLNDGRVYADFVADILSNRDIHIKSDGMATRAFCYIADATMGFFTVLLNGENGQAYNVGNDLCEISIMDLANRLTTLFPDKKLNVVKDCPANDSGYLKSNVSRSCPDITKIATLGWQPKTSIEDGFRRTVLSFL